MLEYVGPRLSTGEIERTLVFDGIPGVEMLDESTLTTAQIEKAISSGLYRVVKSVTKKPAEPVTEE